MIDLKQIGQGFINRISLCTLLALTLFVAGCTTLHSQDERTEDAISYTSEPEATFTAEPPGTQSNPQRLRITNQSAIPLHNLVVIFPEDRIEFGDVLAGATTDYQVAPHGVYRYAAYAVEVDGQKYEQPVVDWVGEIPMQGNAFMYTLETDPSRWETEGRVLVLIKVTEDQATSFPASTQQLTSPAPTPESDRIALPPVAPTPSAHLTGAIATYTDPVIGYSLDYPGNWYEQGEPGWLATLTSFPLAKDGRGGLKPDQAKIDLLPTKPYECESLQQLEEEAHKGEGKILWEEQWLLAGEIPAVRMQIDSEVFGESALLLTVINGRCLRMAGMGETSLFDAIATSLTPTQSSSLSVESPSSTTPPPSSSPTPEPQGEPVLLLSPDGCRPEAILDCLLDQGF